MPYLIFLPSIHSEEAGGVILWRVSPLLPECVLLVLAQPTNTPSHNHEKKTFLVRYVTTLKFGLRHVASWMKSGRSLEKMGLMLLSNGAKFLLPPEAYLIYLHARKNRVYSLTRLPFAGGVYSTLQTLILRTQPQGQKVILSQCYIGTKRWAKDRDETGTKFQCTVLLTRLEPFQQMEGDFVYYIVSPKPIKKILWVLMSWLQEIKGVPEFF